MTHKQIIKHSDDLYVIYPPGHKIINAKNVKINNLIKMLEDEVENGRDYVDYYERQSIDGMRSILIFKKN